MFNESDLDSIQIRIDSLIEVMNQIKGWLVVIVILLGFNLLQ
jgi:hypothetical protein